MAQPNPPAAVITAIKLDEESGRAMTDTEVAALAAGVLELDDLTGIVVPMIQSDGKEASTSQNPGESDEDIVSSDVDDDEEEEEEEEGDKKEESKEPEARLPVGAMDVDGEQNDGQNDGDSKANGEAKADGVSHGAGHGIDLGVGAGQGKAAGEAENVHKAQEGVSSQESSDESSGSDSSDGETIPQRQGDKKKPIKCPVSGPLAFLHVGDISDGEDEDGFGAGVPMTKNEAEEPILPLGEVTMDGTEVMEVGTILSLVEADGTIVVQGTQGSPPLDEGSVLASHVKGSEASGTTEPLGRIHEIFGPCHTPHYTVKVEGAANKQGMVARFQTAKKQLVKAEKEQAQQAKAKAKPPVLRPPSADDPTGAAMAVKAEAAEAEGTSSDKPTPMSTADMAESAPKDGDAKMAALRKAVCDAEAAMSERKDHPFQRWQVGAKVYALKDHAKFLAKELLIPTGKGTDASNCHDEEADEEEFSDDEEERLAKLREKKDKKRSHMMLKGVTPEGIASMEKEEEEQRRIAQEHRQAERATNGDAGGRGGRGGRGARGGRGRGGRSDRGRGRRSGNSNSDANGAGYHSNGGVHDGGDGGIANVAASSENGWKANAQGHNSQAPYGNGSPPAYAPGGGMIRPQGHLQQGPPAGYVPAPFVPAHPFSARGPSLHSGAPGPNGQPVLQGPGGGFYPGFDAGAAGGFPHPQHQQPRFMSPLPMIVNPSQYVQQQQQQQVQYQTSQQFQPQHPQQQQPYFGAGSYFGQNNGVGPMFAPPQGGSAPTNGSYGPPRPGVGGTFPPGGHHDTYYSWQ